MIDTQRIFIDHLECIMDRCTDHIHRGSNSSVQGAAKESALIVSILSDSYMWSKGHPLGNPDRNHKIHCQNMAKIPTSPR